MILLSVLTGTVTMSLLFCGSWAACTKLSGHGAERRRAIAEGLGLTARSPFRRMRGVIHDVVVHVLMEVDTTRESAPCEHTTCEALLVPSLRMGVSIAHGQGASTGDGAFDERFDATADNQGDLRELLNDRVRDALLETRRFAPIEITDDAVRYRFNGRVQDLDVLQTALDNAATIAKTLLSARREMPPRTYEARVIEEWSPVFHMRGYRFNTGALRAEGHHGGATIETKLVRCEREEFKAVITARFDHPIDSWFTVRMRQGVDGRVARFDELFKVHGTHEAITTLVTDDLRQNLVGLGSRASKIVISERSITAELSGSVDEPTLDSALSRVQNIAAVIAARSGRRGSAYR